MSTTIETTESEAGERAAFLAGFWTFAAATNPEQLPNIELDHVPATYPVQQPKLFQQFPPALAIAGACAVVFFHQERPHDACVPADDIMKYVPLDHRNFICYKSVRDITNLRLQILDVDYALSELHELYIDLKRRLLEGEDLDGRKVKEIAEAAGCKNGLKLDAYFAPAHLWMQERRRRYASAIASADSPNSESC